MFVTLFVTMQHYDKAIEAKRPEDGQIVLRSDAVKFPAGSVTFYNKGMRRGLLWFKPLLQLSYFMSWFGSGSYSSSAQFSWCTANFSERYVVNAQPLRSHFRLSVRMSVCLSVRLSVTHSLTSNNSKLVRDRAILAMVEWHTKRKSYMMHGIVPFSITINDP